jgi:hypothetical protein
VRPRGTRVQRATDGDAATEADGAGVRGGARRTTCVSLLYMRRGHKKQSMRHATAPRGGGGPGRPAKRRREEQEGAADALDDDGAWVAGSDTEVGAEDVLPAEPPALPRPARSRAADVSADALDDDGLPTGASGTGSSGGGGGGGEGASLTEAERVEARRKKRRLERQRKQVRGRLALPSTQGPLTHCATRHTGTQAPGRRARGRSTTGGTAARSCPGGVCVATIPANSCRVADRPRARGTHPLGYARRRTHERRCWASPCLSLYVCVHADAVEHFVDAGAVTVGEHTDAHWAEFLKQGTRASLPRVSHGRARKRGQSPNACAHPVEPRWRKRFAEAPTGDKDVGATQKGTPRVVIVTSAALRAVEIIRSVPALALALVPPLSLVCRPRLSRATPLMTGGGTAPGRWGSFTSCARLPSCSPSTSRCGGTVCPSPECTVLSMARVCACVFACWGLQVPEQVAYLQAHTVRIAVGTPNRLSKLVEEGDRQRTHWGHVCVAVLMDICLLLYVGLVASWLCVRVCLFVCLCVCVGGVMGSRRTAPGRAGDRRAGLLGGRQGPHAL